MRLFLTPPARAKGRCSVASSWLGWHGLSSRPLCSLCSLLQALSTLQKRTGSKLGRLSCKASLTLSFLQML